MHWTLEAQLYGTGWASEHPYYFKYSYKIMDVLLFTRIPNKTMFIKELTLLF